MILIEATGFAMLNPALYAVVAANSPIGRSSTAQGIFGAAGTVGFIVASLIAGVLAQQNIVYPMYVFSAVLLASLVVGLLIGGRRLDGRPAAIVSRGRCRPSLSLSTATQGQAERSASVGRLTERCLGPRVTGRGVEQRQLVGLITRRSEVRILSPQPSRIHLEPRARPPGVLSCPANGAVGRRCGSILERDALPVEIGVRIPGNLFPRPTGWVEKQGRSGTPIVRHHQDLARIG